MNDEYSISIIIPVYNERELLENSLRVIDNFLKNNFKDYEIVIVESGSTDGSYEICDKLAENNPKVRVIHEGSRNGFGSALKVGYNNAKKDLIWMVTADLPFPLETIFQALPLLGGYDCVLSFRSKDGRGLFKAVQSATYNTIVQVLLGLKVRDVNSAFKVFRKDTIKNIKLVSDGWLIDAEILYRLKKRNITYAEIAVPMIRRKGGKSSIRLLTFMDILRELLRFLKIKDK